MAGYVWSGEAQTPTPPKPKRARRPRKNAAECGTYSGYRTHKNKGQEACRECKDAMAAYCREYRERIQRGELTPRKGFTPDRCGSRAGYIRHRKHSTTACQPCLAANAQYMREYNAERKAA